MSKYFYDHLNQSNLLYDHLKDVVNRCWNYAKRCETFNDHLQNAVLGLAGESGEVADVVKKMLYHSKGKDYHDKIKHELGDVIFYWLKTVELMGLTVEEVLEANRDKLESRHPELGKTTQRFPEGYIK